MPTPQLQMLRNEARNALEQDTRFRDAEVSFVDAGFFNDQVTVSFTRAGGAVESVMLPRRCSLLTDSTELRRNIAVVVWCSLSL